MIKKSLYIYPVVSGILLALAWNSFLPAFSLFFAFIPLLYLINYTDSSNRRVFNSSFIAYFIFHLATVWWIYKSGIAGFLAVIIINSFLMAAATSLANYVKQVYAKFAAYWAFAVFWISFEYIHYSWDLQWPFMNLGNWMGQIPEYIQWYEYTGILGGSLWILLINIFLLEVYQAWKEKRIKNAVVNSMILFFILIFPLRASFNLQKVNLKKHNTVTAVIVQPNIDPYTEKYDTALYKTQISNQLKMAEQALDSSVHLLIFPETSFPLYLDKSRLEENEVIRKLQNLCVKYPALSVIAGLYTYKLDGADTLYYNTAVFINNQGKIGTHDKSKLVPAVERTPFIRFLKIFKNSNVDFGGINASLNISDKQTLFEHRDIKIAPLICYESVFGAYSAGFVEKGTNLTVVITNDAWWGNTPAYRQILMHSQLRAIETRRQIIRVANTGISGLIDEKGNLLEQLPVNTKAVLKVNAEIIEKETFYTEHGDIIGRLSAFTAVILLLASYVKRKKEILP